MHEVWEILVLVVLQASVVILHIIISQGIGLVPSSKLRAEEGVLVPTTFRTYPPKAVCQVESFIHLQALCTKCILHYHFLLLFEGLCT